MITKLTQERAIAAMVRVNHAGEYGALGIYKGQLKRPSCAHKEIQEMYDQEVLHFEYFDQEIRRRKIRPTLLMPLWKAGSRTLGAMSARMGVEGMMACTEAVERVIVRHYNAQLESMEDMYPQDDELKEAVARFRDDELRHHDDAGQYTKSVGSFSPIRVFGRLVEVVCAGAISLSQKI